MSLGPVGGALAPLLERDSELTLAGGLLDRALGGSGGLVRVHGPAGIGKSAVLERVAAEAERAGARVQRARCSELETAFSFGGARQLFEPVLAASDAQERDSLLSGSAALTMPLFDQGEPGGEGPGGVFTIVHGLYWLSSNIAAERPLLLALDDVHWADVATLRFLLYLAPRIGDLPLAVVYTERPLEGPEATGLRSQLASDERTLELALGPLSAGATGELVRSRFPDAEPEFWAACHGVTGGNPFLLRELLGELEAASVQPDRDAAERVSGLAPASVTRTALVRLGRLPPAATELAFAVAVLGDDARLDTAARLAELDLAEAQDAADALAGVDLLAAADPLAFVHPLIRTAVAESIPPRRRERLNAAAARMLREAGAGPESIAAYLLASERSGDRERVGALCAAAQTANARGAPESAAIYLARALEEPPDFVQRASLLLELAQSEAASGSPAAREHFEEALESAEDSGLRARILLGLGRLVYASGQAVEAASRFDEAARIAAQAGLHELEMELEVEYWQAATLDPSLAALTGPRVHRVVESLPEAEPSPAERAVLAAAGLDALKSGEPRAEVLNLAERAYGDGAMVDQLGSDSSALYLVTGTLHCADACERDIEILDRALADARRRGSVLAFATASYARSAPLHRVGRIDEAVADMEAALDARRYGWEQFLTYACGQLTILHIERDDLAAARDATALIDPAQWEPLPFWSQFLRGRGALALAEGRWADALADFAEWGERWPVPTPIFYARWRSPAAIAAAQLGDRDRAVALAAEELELVRPFGSARADGMALAALGLATGGDEGVVSLRAAVERLETSDSRLDLCRTLIDLGAAQRRANQRTEARASLERGLDMATRFGARRLARIAREELEVAGGRPRSPYLSGVESLTPGELRVARMAASGMTNREIAEALFVTVKAVQWHLRHVYQKLETTRAGLAAALEAGSP